MSELFFPLFAVDEVFYLGLDLAIVEHAHLELVFSLRSLVLQFILIGLDGFAGLQGKDLQPRSGLLL